VARHTSATSAEMVDRLVAMRSPPARKTGTMTSIPQRSPTWSPSQPMTGSTTSPGITQSAPTANPIDRARGGMARERVARIPGASTASVAEITEWAATATQTLGAAANTSSAALTTHAVCDRNPRMCSGPLAMSRVATRAPMMSPTSAQGSAAAAANPR
jgi:hypothetical protein